MGEKMFFLLGCCSDRFFVGNVLLGSFVREFVKIWLGGGGSFNAIFVRGFLSDKFYPVEFGPVEFGPVEFGSVEFGPVEFGPVEFGPVEFGPVELGSVEFGPVEFGRVEFFA